MRLHRRFNGPSEWCDTFQLPALGTSVAEARRRVLARLREWDVPEDVRDDAEVIVSELFTNAVRHTESRTVGCEVRYCGDRLRVEVADQGRAASVPRRRDASVDEEGGRGLLLVAALAEVWGVTAAPIRRGSDRDDCGRMVWAVLRVN